MDIAILSFTFFIREFFINEDWIQLDSISLSMICYPIIKSISRSHKLIIET